MSGNTDGPPPSEKPDDVEVGEVKMKGSTLYMGAHDSFKCSLCFNGEEFGSAADFEKHLIVCGFIVKEADDDKKDCTIEEAASLAQASEKAKRENRNKAARETRAKKRLTEEKYEKLKDKLKEVSMELSIYKDVVATITNGVANNPATQAIIQKLMKAGSSDTDPEYESENTDEEERSERRRKRPNRRGKNTPGGRK